MNEKIESKRVQRTRRDISNAFISLLLERDFDDISIVDICETALITRATFYKYFEDKYHLVSCIIDDYKDKIFEDKLKHYEYTSTKDLFIYIAQVILDMIEDNRDNLSKIYQHVKMQKLQQQVLNIIDLNLTNILKEQKENMNFEVPLKIISKFFAGGFTILALSFLEEPDVYKKEYIIKFVENEIEDKLNRLQ